MKEKLLNLVEEAESHIANLVTKTIEQEIPISKVYTEVLAKTELGFSEYDVGLVDSYVELLKLTGDRYRITWDDIPYECNVVDMGKYTVCGNPYLANKSLGTEIPLDAEKSEDKGMPFVIIIHDTYLGIITICDVDPNEVQVVHTISIDKVTINKLGIEYLPEEVIPDAEIGQWEKLTDYEVHTATKSLNFKIKDDKAYDAFCVVLSVPTVEDTSNIELKIDGRSIGKVTSALATDEGRKTLIRIDAEKRYFWTADYSIAQLTSTVEPRALTEANIPYSINEKMFNFAFKNKIDKVCSSSVEVATTSEMPVGTVMIITGRRAKK